MSYAAWDPPYRVTTISPGRLDLFVATLIDGRVATVQPIMEYDEALAKALLRLFGSSATHDAALAAIDARLAKLEAAQAKKA